MPTQTASISAAPLVPGAAAAPKIAALKVDVQGSEKDVFLGARRLLCDVALEHRPMYVIFEDMQLQGEAVGEEGSAIGALLHSCGYVSGGLIELNQVDVFWHRADVRKLSLKDDGV